MSRYADYGTRKKPIRKDRVAIAVVIVAAIIAVPFLLRSGCTGPSEPLVVVDEGTDVRTTLLPGVTTGDEPLETTTPESTETGLLETIATGEILTHTVEDGETLGDVATELGVSVESLRASNLLYGSEPVQPGRILIASREGVLHVIKQGQTLTDIAVTYAVPKETIAEANGISVNQTIFAGERLLVPTSTDTYWENVVTLSRGIPARFVWPLSGEVVSEFGWREHPVLGDRHHHDGIDIDVPEGTLVHAAASGTVFFYGEQPGYGNVLILEHGDGFLSMYGHLASSFVEQGRFVEVGQGVAQSGNTGISSGPHLHFEVRNGNFPIDPYRYLP
ncbi:MAG: M23 family metallopeptidase [Candidatus Bipolaricaulia bacterium]